MSTATKRDRGGEAAAGDADAKRQQVGDAAPAAAPPDAAAPSLPAVAVASTASVGAGAGTDAPKPAATATPSAGVGGMGSGGGAGSDAGAGAGRVSMPSSQQTEIHLGDSLPSVGDSLPLSPTRLSDDDGGPSSAADGGGGASAAVEDGGGGGADGEGADAFDDDDPDALLKRRVQDIKANPKLLSRYRHFMRSRLNPETVRRQLLSIIQPAQGVDIPEDVVILMACTAKMFAGDVVEEARGIMPTGSNLPIRPEYLREAYRRMIRRHDVPYVTHNALD